MSRVGLIAPEQTYALRLRVLWPHLDHKSQCKIDVDKDGDTFHVGSFDKSGVVGIGTFLVEKNKSFVEDRQYRLRAMATSPEVRGKNFGKNVIEFAINELKNKHVELLWCHARKVAIGFYERMGFEIEGGYYDIPLIGPHKLMYYRLN